jgi:lipopolysaccharide export system permease protein
LNTDLFYPIKVKKGYVKYNLNLNPKEINNFNEDPDQKSISELRQFINKYYQRGSERQRLLVDYHLKFALPFASLVLAWLGAPLALRPQRRSSAAGFGLCIIFILIWYALMGLGTYMARAGVLTPFLGAWLPNLALAGYGTYITVNTKS